MPNQKDRRVIRTKKILRKELMNLLQTHNIKDITVKQLTDLADINRGTFYIHYKDIYDMLDQIENEIFQDFNTLLSRHSEIPISDRSYMLLKDIFEFLGNNSDICTALLGPNGDKQFMDKLKDMIRTNCMHMWIAEFKNCEYFDYFYSYNISGIIGLVEYWFKTDRALTTDQLATLASKMLLTTAKTLLTSPPSFY